MTEINLTFYYLHALFNSHDERFPNLRLQETSPNVAILTFICYKVVIIFRLIMIYCGTIHSSIFPQLHGPPCLLLVSFWTRIFLSLYECECQSLAWAVNGILNALYPRVSIPILYLIYSCGAWFQVFPVFVSKWNGFCSLFWPLESRMPVKNCIKNLFEW